MPTGTLPKEGADLHKKVYDSALKGSCKGDKECAAREAWAAVKNAGWSKVGEKWVKKSDIVPEFSMYFSKVGTTSKRWSMTASDTLLDQRNEAMSLELYKSFIDNIETDSPIPKPFDAIVTDSFWNGGMPYVSVSHYSDLEGEGVPGDIHAVYVDGNRLKAKGEFNDTPLGVAAWKAILADKNNPDPNNKVRVSIGFLDLAHKHGDFVFERKSFDDTCPMCDKSVGNKTYLKGYLVHLALTRKPVNPRSEVEVDLSMTTRKEDAASIVGDELAEELSEKNKALAQFADVIVERADAAPAEDNDADEMSSGTASNMPMMEDSDTVLVEEAVTKTEGGCSHPSSHFLVVGDPQKVTTWHLRVKDCQGNVDTRLLGAAKAALTSPGGHRGNKYAGPDKQAAIAKLKRLYASQNLKWQADVDEELSQDVTLEELSMTEPEIIDLMQNAPVIDETEPTIKDVMDALGKLTSLVTPPAPVEKSSIDLKYESLATVMKSAMDENIPVDEKLMKIQPALNELGDAIREEVSKPVSTGQGETSQPATASVEDIVNKALQPVIEQMAMLTTKLSQPTQPVPAPRVPQPRGYSASPLAVKSLVATEQKKLSPIDQIAARSVGLEVD